MGFICCRLAALCKMHKNISKQECHAVSYACSNRYRYVLKHYLVILSISEFFYQFIIKDSVYYKFQNIIGMHMLFIFLTEKRVLPDLNIIREEMNTEIFWDMEKGNLKINAM